MDKVAELIKAGKVKEIADMRDETDLSGLKLTIDLKRGADPEKLMQKLFRSTPLHGQRCRCNFNVLIAGHAPRDGRARAFAGVVRLADGVRAPPGLLHDAARRRKSCIC